MYENYILFQKEFEKRYRDLIYKYPLSSYVIENELKLLLIGRKSEVQSVIKSYRRYFYTRKLLRSINVFYKKSSNKQIYISLIKKRFYELTEIISKYFKIRNYRVLSNNSLFFFRFNNLSSLLFTSSSSKEFFLNFQKQLINNELNTDLFNNFEIICRRELAFTIKFLKKNKIKLIFLNDQSSIYSKIIIAASNKLKINCIVINHGFIQSQNLISIMPKYSNHFLVWTDYEKKLLNKIDLKNQFSSVRLPFIYNDTNKIFNHKLLIITMCYSAKIKNYYEVLNKILFYLDKFNLKLFINLHPRDDNKIFKSNLKKNLSREDTFDIHFASLSFLVNLKFSCKVIGYNTSSIYDYASYGFDCYQIHELNFIKMPYINSINFTDLKYIFQNDIKNYKNIFTNKKIINKFLDGLIDE